MTLLTRLRPRFGLKWLLGWFVAASVLVAYDASILRADDIQSQSWWWHTAVSLLPVVMVVGSALWRKTHSNVLARLSLVMYLLALVTPTTILSGFLFGDALTAYGWWMLYVSFAAIPDAFHEPLTGLASALIVCGCLANVLFYVATIAWWWHRRRGYAVSIARPTATAAAVLATFISFQVYREFHLVFLGHGLWTASLLALAFASWRAKSEQE